jgi:hypothetical protein
VSPARSKVVSLPDDVRSWLDGELVRGGFQGYRELAEQLQQRGFEISHAAVHRYGQQFEEQLGAIRLATEQARAIAEAAGDDEGVLNDAVIRLIQTKSFEVLSKLSAESLESESFTDLGNMLARLGKAAIDQKKWATSVREKVAAKLDEMERKASQGKRSGIDLETLRQVREEIYGIVR